jgi:hypothetical protein
MNGAAREKQAPRQGRKDVEHCSFFGVTIMLKRTLMMAAAACTFAAAPAYAQVNLSAVPGSDPYAGPAPTYDFESPAPVSGGLVTTGDLSGISAQPYGSTGNFWTVGPTDGSPGEMNLSSFAGIASISFIWGSVDSYNTLEVLDRLGNVLETFTGADAAVSPNGNQTDPITNPLALLTFSGTTQGNIGGLRLSSTSNAFETDNFAVTAVPEPGAWAMLLIGFGFIGAFLRGQKRTRRIRLKYA